MQTKTPRRLGSKLGVTAAALLLFVGVLSATAMGLFTDSDSVPANAFSTATVSLTTSPTTGLITFSGMVPGDQVTAPLTVTNNGTAALRYAVTSTTTENTLATQLSLTVKTGVTTCTTAGFGSSGTVVYGPAPLGNTVPLAIIGNTAQGAQAGDRALAVGANESLCFNVSLPIASSNTFQNLSTTATFTFASEQTANNP